MKKFAAKLIVTISFVVVFVTLLTIAVNSVFIERYYLKTKKQELNLIYEQILTREYEDVNMVIDDIEKKEEVFIAYVQNTEDEELLNYRLRESFELAGLPYRKLWVWEKDLKRIRKTGTSTQIYNQGKLNYSLLIKFSVNDDHVFAIAKMIPHVTETIGIINRFTIILFSGALPIIVIIITLLAKRFIRPLAQLTELSQDIANRNYRQISVKTNDEIEVLANSINCMSLKLYEIHKELEQKNNSMKNLLSNVSHEIKTPLALIKAYCSGMNDGLDDGTFLNVIVQQNERIQELVERLIELSAIEGKELIKEQFCLSDMITKLIETYDISIKNHDIDMDANVAENIWIIADKENIFTVLTNLLSNALKYTNNQQIELKFDRNAVFQIRNGASNNVISKIEKLWEPFFVGEESRNKDLSGSGLGLSIVKSILEKHEYDYDCKVVQKSIEFTIQFKSNNSQVQNDET